MSGERVQAAGDPRITRIGHFLRRTSLDEPATAVQRDPGRDESWWVPRPVIRAELERYGDDVDYFPMVRRA